MLNERRIYLRCFVYCKFINKARFWILPWRVQHDVHIRWCSRGLIITGKVSSLGINNTSGAHEFTPLSILNGVRVSHSLVFYLVFRRSWFVVLSFFLLVILVSVHRLTASIFTFGIFKLFSVGNFSVRPSVQLPYSHLASLSFFLNNIISPIRRGFAPDFVNYKNGAFDSQPQVILLTSCLPMVDDSLRVLRLLPPLKLVSMI